MYGNLERAMKERGITKKALADFLDVRHATVVDKTNGNSRFFLDEALKIQAEFFPDLEIQYLFTQTAVD